MKNIHVLPTDKPSRLYFNNNDKCFQLCKVSKKSTPLKINQHIYITSDEEIKEGDWWLNIKTNDVDKCTHKSEVSVYNSQKYQHIKKIILSTDPELIAYGVQSIDDEFLEWFVKNPSCEEVNAYWYEGIEVGHFYKIIIPKEETKQETLEEVECNNCGYLMSLTEDESVYACYNSECTSCYEEYEEEPKQETSEEAAERLYPTTIDSFTDNGFDLSERERLIFINGVKWQQEQDKNKFSEEEVRNIVEQTIEKFYKHRYVETKSEMKELWFEQFKKK